MGPKETLEMGVLAAGAVVASEKVAVVDPAELVAVIWQL